MFGMSSVWQSSFSLSSFVKLEFGREVFGRVVLVRIVLVKQDPASPYLLLKMRGSSKANITEFLISQVSELPLLKDCGAEVAGEAGAVPELPPEGVAHPSDGLEHGRYRAVCWICHYYLPALLTLAQHGGEVAGLAEEAVPEDHIVQSDPFTAHRAVKAGLVPS